MRTPRMRDLRFWGGRAGRLYFPFSHYRTNSPIVLRLEAKETDPVQVVRLVPISGAQIGYIPLLARQDCMVYGV
jgi:hypothetical protein